MPIQFVALQLSTTLNCYATVLTGIPGNKSSAFGMGCSLIHFGLMDKMILEVLRFVIIEQD
jgi:hypothetical protein